MLLALPPPLYSPADNWDGSGGGGGRGDGGARSFTADDAVYVERWTGGAGVEGVEGMRHPLVIKSGAAKLGGAVNASIAAHGGESGRYVL